MKCLVTEAKGRTLSRVCGVEQDLRDTQVIATVMILVEVAVTKDRLT